MGTQEGLPPAAVQNAGLSDTPDVHAGPTAAAKRWNRVGHMMKLGLAATGNFSTLRDQHGLNEIQASQLKFIKHLGEGAFANVEKSEYSLPDGAGTRLVAVKRMKPDVIRDAPHELEAFVTECNLMRKLKHKYIVEYIGVGYQLGPDGEPADSSPFLVQELMEGGCIKKLLLKQMREPHSRVYSNAQALGWCTQIASALAYLHTANPVVIHRDLKLDNILLTGDKQVAKLADFGLAGFSRRSASRKGPLSPTSSVGMPRPARSLTMSKSLSRSASVKTRAPLMRSRTLRVSDQMSGKTGTLIYMAPEMWSDHTYNEKVDVYSCGVIMFELFSRYLHIERVAVQGTEEEVEAYAARVSEGYRPPLEETGIPPELASLIQDCWAHDPAARPTMPEVVQRLQGLIGLALPEPPSGCMSGSGCMIM